MDFSKLLSYLALFSFGIFAFVVYVNAKTIRWKIVSSMLMALVLAIIAYSFVPKNNIDLVRHHQEVKEFMDIGSFDEFSKVANSMELEPVPKLVSFIVAIIGDCNLLQTIFVFIGYSLLFYILIDCKNRFCLSVFSFVSIMILVIFGQHMLYYFSGLYNYFAINMFAFGFYLEYSLKRGKLAWLFYLISPLIHSSMFLPLGAIVLFKLLRERVTKQNVIFLIASLLAFDLILGFLVNWLNITPLIQAKNTYDTYVLHNNILARFYEGFYFIMTVTELLIILFACYLKKNSDKEDKKIVDFVFIFSIIVIALSFNSLAITRFVPLALFMSIPLIVSSVKQKNDLSFCLTIIYGVVGFSYFVYTINAMAPYVSFGGAL